MLCGKGGTMNKKSLIMLSTFALTIYTSQAAPDCITDTRDLTTKIDFKEYHLTECYHNCYTDPHSTLIGDRTYCTGCGHYHMPRPYIILSSNDLLKNTILKSATVHEKRGRYTKQTLPLVPQLLYGPPIEKK